MLGNIEEAFTVSAWQWEEDRYGFIPPPGFDHIGDGADRIAFLSHQTNVIYKREFDPCEGMNQMEFDNYQRLQSIPCKGWKIPETDLFFADTEPIIVMEYVVGQTDIFCERVNGRWNRKCTCGKPGGFCVAEAWEQPVGLWNIQDVNLGNVIVLNDGTRVLIDLAS